MDVVRQRSTARDVSHGELAEWATSFVAEGRPIVDQARARWPVAKVGRRGLIQVGKCLVDVAVSVLNDVQSFCEDLWNDHSIALHGAQDVNGNPAAWLL